MPPKPKSRTAAACAAKAEARKPARDVLPAALKQAGWTMVQSESMGMQLAKSPGGKRYMPNSDRYRARAFSEAPEVGKTLTGDSSDNELEVDKGAGMLAQPGSDMPSASAREFIDSAVPMVLQWPRLGAEAATISMKLS